MKVALLSDIHGNLPALEAVLAHAGELKVKTIWNLGDFTGFGAFPDDVVLLLKKLKAVSIIGNYDQKVLKVPQKSDEWKEKKVPEKWFSFQWAYEHLSKKSIKYLEKLPETNKALIKDWKVLFTHGSPESIDEALNDETPQERLRDLARKARVDIILCGHSHEPFMRFAGGAIFVNPGSVGRPFDGDPRASYAILSIKKHKVEVDFFRIEYDSERAAAAQISAGLPAAYADMTRRGVSLDDLAVQQPAVPEVVETDEPKPAARKRKPRPTASSHDENVEVTREVIQPDPEEKKPAARRKSKPAENP